MLSPPARTTRRALCPSKEIQWVFRMANLPCRNQVSLPARSIDHDPATNAPGPGLNTPRQESGRRKRMPHTEDCSIRTRSGLEEVTELRLSMSDTRRRDFTENAEIGQWQFLQDAIDSAPIPELGSPGRGSFSPRRARCPSRVRP